MRTYPLGLIALMMLSGVGCVHLQPVGPMAKTLGVPAAPGPSNRPAPGVKVSDAQDSAAAPMLPTAPPPTPPAYLVTPGEVTETNPQHAVRRLAEEMSADTQAMERMPRYSEISYVK